MRLSVLPSLISPLQDVEVPPCSYAADYAAPAMPAFETVLESPVPEESGVTWIPGFVPVSEVVREEEGSCLRLLEEPLPPKAVTATTAPLATDLILPTVPPTPDENVTVPVTEGARKTERAQVFVVEGTEGSPHRQGVRIRTASDRTYQGRDPLMCVRQIMRRGSRRWC